MVFFFFFFTSNQRDKSDHRLLGSGFHVKILAALMLSYSNKWEVLLCISNILFPQIKICLRQPPLHTSINYQCGDFLEPFRERKSVEWISGQDFGIGQVFSNVNIVCQMP